MNKFAGANMIHKRKIIRLQNFDYLGPKNYFVTIEPNNKKYPFCKINDGKIILNDIGRIIEVQWKWLFDQYPYIGIDEYVIMPDHFHGIIRYLPEYQIPKFPSKSSDFESVRAIRESSSEKGKAPLSLPKIKPLPEIIGAFKTTSSKIIHLAGYKDFKWKRSFNDRILRNYELGIKREYIKNNPLKKNSTPYSNY